MATVLQTILDRLDVILKANAPVGCTVFRDNVDAASRAEAPCINVLADAADVAAFSDDMDALTGKADSTGD